MSLINLQHWLIKEVGTGTDTQTGVPGGPPMGQPAMGGMPPQQGGTPNIANQPQQMTPDKPEKMQLPDASSDPKVPDMPEKMGNDDKNFEVWKKEFIVESIKGDVQALKDSILQIRDRDLDAYQRKFVEDNLQILFLRENSNIDQASKEIRKLIKDELDHNNPATTVVNHMATVLEKSPPINNIFIKLTGLRGMKGECHREFIAALLGAVQVGSGAYNADLIYNEKDYSIRISTRLNARFGEVHLGEWSLKEDDPQRYLKAPEMQRLNDGSPEEKETLRKRIIMESIAQEFEKRAFIINVVNTDGTIYTLGWDLASSLKAAYTEGKLIVKTTLNDNNEAMITNEGDIVPLVDVKIVYAYDDGELDEDGKPSKKEIEFMHRKYGQLFLTAPLPVLKKAATSFQGIVLKEIPWSGSPTDLLTLSRCVPGLTELVCRNC